MSNRLPKVDLANTNHGWTEHKTWPNGSWEDIWYDLYGKPYSYACGSAGTKPNACKTETGGSMSDAINSPSHYASGGIECIDAIRAQLTTEELRGYYRGNIVKYLWRYRAKNRVEDLMKAEVYLGWLMTLEREEA